MIVLAGAILVPIVWTALEAALWSMPVLPNQAPVLDAYGIGRALLAALPSLAVLVVFSAHGPASAKGPLSPWQTVMATFSLALLGVFLALFLLSPARFNETSLEDGPVEWASALLPVAASVLLAWRGAGLLAQARGRAAPGLILLFSAVLLFALGMEEISWMQRVFGLHTPEILSGNIQNELNLHNLATNQVGTLHKLMGFVFLVLLPFIHATTPQAVTLPGLAPLIPSRAAALVAAPLAALNYNGWDFLPMQMTTYLTVGIVVYFAWQAWRARRLSEAILCAGMVVAIVVTQVLFIGLGHRFVRIWDVTEYKELFIALGLFVWAVDVFRQGRVQGLRTASR
ncbi:MAG: hypothetical protein AB7F09_19360 [Parvibaculaceae bacterium]